MASSNSTPQDSYLQWLANETATAWWHDSANLDELAFGMQHGAVGATINPILVSNAIKAHPEKWRQLSQSLASSGDDERIEEITKAVISEVAQRLQPIYERTGRVHGYACAQVDPAKAADRDAMIQMARRFHAWRPNIAVKLPVTAAGLDVLEDCIAEGITITATVSYTVPQVIAIAERNRKARERAKQAGQEPGTCFAVIMIGRLDDYLRDMATDRKADVSESDIRQAGLAVTKRAYSIYTENKYEATLIVAALRGTYHMVELAGADIIMSIHPTYQNMLLQPDFPRELRIDGPIAPDVIERLKTLPDFVRSYEPDGMKAEEFSAFGLVQRTLTQFSLAGWLAIPSLDSKG